MLAYDHFTYMLPVLGALILIVRPFINRSEIFKIVLITITNLAYLKLWDTFIIPDGAWTFMPERVNFIIGQSTTEKYMFLIAQIVLTSLWALICVRWTIPCLCFNHNKKSYQLIQWIPISLLSIAMAIGCTMIVPGQATFYLGCLLCWASPAIMYLWYGSGNFFVNKIIPSLIAIVIPTLYLCWVNQKASAVNDWCANKATSSNGFVVEDLPLEEALYFFTTNVIIVLAVLSYDKARGMMETFTIEFPERFGFNLKFATQLFLAFITPEYSMPSVVIQDITNLMRLVNTASRVIRFVSIVFQSGIHLDLLISYTFFRITDDMTDDKSLHIDEKKPKLKLYLQFLDELFADRKSDYDIFRKPCLPKMNWTLYQSQFSDAEMSCCRALSRIAFYLPRKPFYEALEGYQWDVDHKLIRNERGLMEYCDFVAGGFGAISLFTFMYRSDNGMNDVIGKYVNVIEKSRQLARDLQLVNIARDIVYDSITVGRTYIPTSFLDDEENELRILCDKKDARSLGEKKIRKYSSRLIQLYYKYQPKTLDVFNWLPHDVRGGVIALYYIYLGHISVFQSSSTYPTKASVPTWKKFAIILNSIYITTFRNIEYAI